eukprot:422244_1
MLQTSAAKITKSSVLVLVLMGMLMHNHRCNAFVPKHVHFKSLYPPLISIARFKGKGETSNRAAFLTTIGDTSSSKSSTVLRGKTTSRVANFLSSFKKDERTISGNINDDDASSGNLDNNDNDDDVEGKVTSETPLEDAETETVEASTTATFHHQANQTPELQWDVYVCQSKPCKERGSAATLDAFQALSPGSVQIHPAYLHKTKAKGPNIRCIQKVAPFKAFEVNNVNDIDKVYRILTKHMGLGNEISVIARDSLKLTYTGNAYLEKNQLTEAIASYSAALDTGYDPQEGILLLLRATAYLKRAFEHQAQLRLAVKDLSESVPDPESLGRLYQLAALHPSLSKSLFNKVLIDAKMQDRKFRKIKYRHGLYEYALLHAAQDSLSSTQLLPHHAKTWLRAGDALAELRKLKESTLYYQKAINLDPSLKDRLEPVIERLERSQTFLDKAKGWWSSDTLRLALDVAG